jgi:4-hydroxybenzoate polyprenyltransferase
LRAILRAMRPHQWSKNLLVAVPPFMGQAWDQPAAVWATMLAFLALSLAASGGYLINDLIDLEADRNHPEKKRRPLAAGELSKTTCLITSALLILAATIIALVGLNLQFTGLLLTYILGSLAYSVVLKRFLLIDVFVLAGLYTLRILAGGAAADVWVSSWLLLFSMFFFLSLAFAKRLTALETGAEPERPYRNTDIAAFRSVGPASGMLSVLILALYVTSDTVRSLYNQPQLLWLLCPLMLYWILRIWFITLRGKLDQDPVVFALRDRASYAVMLVILIVVFFAYR